MLLLSLLLLLLLKQQLTPLEPTGWLPIAAGKGLRCVRPAPSLSGRAG